jgi:hypothetical protein
MVKVETNYTHHLPRLLVVLVSDVLSTSATFCITLHVHDVYTLFNYDCSHFAVYASMKYPPFTKLVLIMEKVMLADTAAWRQLKQVFRCAWMPS